MLRAADHTSWSCSCGDRCPYKAGASAAWSCLVATVARGRRCGLVLFLSCGGDRCPRPCSRAPVRPSLMMRAVRRADLVLTLIHDVGIIDFNSRRASIWAPVLSPGLNNPGAGNPEVSAATDDHITPGLDRKRTAPSPRTSDTQRLPIADHLGARRR